MTDATKKASNDHALTIEIDRSHATFHMDKNGRWLNEDGPITKKSIIRYLNLAITRDEKGYHLAHNLGNRREKVYFFHEDTALFATDLTRKPTGLSIRLNTRAQLDVQPQNLFIQNDSLYLDQNDHLIKFSERALVKLAPLLQDTRDGLIITVAGKQFPLPTRNA